jgi:hypothetical protein
MTNNLFEVTWDRGKRTAEEVEEKHIYKFECEDCGGEDLFIEPYDVPYLHEVSNKDLPREYVLALYSNALRLDKAIIASGEIRVVCNECENVHNYTKERIREDFVRKWYNNVFKKGAIDLSGGVGSDVK